MATSKNVSMTSEDKDPRGGLTAKGRAKQKAAGHNLKPGVTKPDKELTPEEMQRKGSFLRRHYANPRGPLVDDDGGPTRLALQAQAWGERAPKTEADVKRLADKGARLLEQYHKQRDARDGSGKKGASKKGAGDAKSGAAAAPKASAKKSLTKPSGKGR